MSLPWNVLVQGGARKHLSMFVVQLHRLMDVATRSTFGGACGKTARTGPLNRRTRRAMTLTFTPLHPVFAAECSGVDIGEPISPETSTAIQDAMDRYAVLVFRRGTPLTTEQHIAFT